MSATASLPDVQTAKSVISQRVHVAAFLDKLAAVRPQYMPHNDQELGELLVLGDDLYRAEIKQASVATSRFGTAVSGLRAVLGGTTVKAASQHDNRNRLMNIGAALAVDPEVFACAAALTLAQS